MDTPLGVREPGPTRLPLQRTSALLSPQPTLSWALWDLDVAWGLGWIVSMAEQERASIWHPWVGQNRFIERVMDVEKFRRLYRSHLEDFLARLYVPDRLHRRIDEIAAVIRDPVAAQSAFRLDKFEQTAGLKPVHPSPGENPNSFNWPAHEMSTSRHF